VVRTITFGPWEIQADVDATQLCYRQIEEAPFQGCDCAPCRNFALVEDGAYPQEIRALFRELGIDWRKPFELSHYSKVTSSLHMYGGWHYFCGRIDLGPQSRNSEPYRIDATFEMGMTRPEAPRTPFSNFECVQVDFFTRVPWRSDLTEPD
jgi:hypothetical protein